MKKEKIRTIITQDAEVDDQNSLRHFLLYANEVELKGIVQTSSMFHWIGVEGTKTPPLKEDASFVERMAYAPYDRPNRWTGTDWMFEEIDAYSKVYPNLKRVSADYPSPEYLRSITKIGNIGYPGEMLSPTEGSELIRENILANDPRKLYIQVWGGCNTIARALLDIQREYGETEIWERLHKDISDKVVLTACGEQDTTYQEYIAREWPDIRFVHSMFMDSYAYTWSTMPEGESKDSLRASFMKENILTGTGALLEGYATWMDGKYYEGEPEENQFGANMHLQDNWWGKEVGIGPYVPFDFLSEGDSPTYFMLFDWGFRTLDDFTYGGVSGRYALNTEKVNAKGKQLNYWSPQPDNYTDRSGTTVQTDSMWRYVADIQHDFAARAAWCTAKEGDPVETAPALTVIEGIDRTAEAGETMIITAEVRGGGSTAAAKETKRPNAAAYSATVTARIYEEASTVSGAVLSCAAVSEKTQDPRRAKETADHDSYADTPVNAAFTVQIPASAQPLEKLHIIVQAKNRGRFGLTHYQQVIITIQ